jgi:hypothetical protein
MRFISSVALLAALLSTLLTPAFAAPAEQAADVRSILASSALVMDSTRSMSFSGGMTMTIPMGSTPRVLSMPMSGSYQAPDRMTMTVDMPDMGTSMDMITVGGQIWTRTGQGPWLAAPARDAYASPLGMSHAEWVGGFINPVVTDRGDTYRVTAGLDASDALKAGFNATASPDVADTVDFSGVIAQVSLTIDKATSYMVSMQMDLPMPMPRYSLTINTTTNMTFADFNNMAVEIIAPV